MAKSGYDAEWYAKEAEVNAEKERKQREAAFARDILAPIASRIAAGMISRSGGVIINGLTVGREITVADASIVLAREIAERLGLKP